MTKTPNQFLDHPEQWVDNIQREYLKPMSPIQAGLHRSLYALTWGFVRVSFRFRVEGLDRLPTSRPLIFAPNHESSLDAPLLAAALSYRTIRYTYWAGRKGKLLRNAVLRLLNRVAQTIPVDRDNSALAAGAAVLRKGYNLVWFPEGTRTRDGELQEFKFGVGALAHHFKASVIPVGIDGAFEAYPPNAWLPRIRSRIVIRFGEALSADALIGKASCPHAYQTIADEVRERVDDLI